MVQVKFCVSFKQAEEWKQTFPLRRINLHQFNNIFRQLHLNKLKICFSVNDLKLLNMSNTCDESQTNQTQTKYVAKFGAFEKTITTR